LVEDPNQPAMVLARIVSALVVVSGFWWLQDAAGVSVELLVGGSRYSEVNGGVVGDGGGG
jgi:hypothetical protein